MEENRTLDKIKKCLEMAKSKTSNPHEAEIALRQAHKLLELYDLEMGDVLASMAGESQVPAGSDGEPPAWRIRAVTVENSRLTSAPSGAAAGACRSRVTLAPDGGV